MTRSTTKERRGATPPIRTAAPLLAVGTAAAAATLAISVSSSLRFAYESPSAHVAMETSACLIAALAATLVAGRAVRSGSRSELLLCAALVVLALSNLVFGLVPSLAEWDERFSAWGGLAGRTAGATLFAAAALAPESRLQHAAGAVRTTLVTTLAATGLAALVFGLAVGELPVALDPDLAPGGANAPRVVGNPVLVATQAMLVVLYSLATVGFARRAARRSDRLLRGFAVAALLSAFARLNYFLFPSLYSDWVYTGDVLRLAHYVVILVAVAFELLENQRRAGVVAVLDERRRVARELHDGLAQELAYLRAEASRVARSSDHVGARGLVSAADRAIAEAREAIATLSRELDEPLAETLRHSAQPVAERAGTRLQVEVEGDLPDVPPEVRHALARLVREATTNATRHGAAKTVTLKLTGAGGGDLRLAVVDDGSGFDPQAGVRADAFGLAGMQERVEALGGTMQIRSRPGAGTRVEVELP